MAEIVKSSREQQVLLRKYRAPLYDEEKIGDGDAVSEITLFSRREGEEDRAGHPKSKRDTNMTASGALGSKQEFYLVGLTVNYDWKIAVVDNATAAPANARNELYIIEQLMNDSLLEFQFGRQQALIEIPMDRIPCGTGPHGSISNNYSSAGTTTVSHVLTNGFPSVREMYDVRLRKARPRHIQQEQAFTVKIKWLNAQVTVGSASYDDYYRIMVYLMGILLSTL
jgi:hypothetical protein